MERQPTITQQIAIIGAGAAGLIAGAVMTDAGADVILYEQQSAPGGIWVYDPATEPNPLGSVKAEDHKHGALYASLHTNLPRDLMAFERYTFDSAGGGGDTWKRYPPHRQVQEYLARFADQFELAPRIRYNSRVTRVAPMADGRWHLQTDRGEASYDRVIVCNGHYARPRVPELPGASEYKGLRLHSKNYRDPSPFKDLRVALWGAAASGVDIGREIATVAKATYWCGDRFENRRPPAAPEPGKVYNCRSPDQFTGALELAFGDRRLEIDAFVYCTGYQYAFDFLSPEIVSVDDNHVAPVYRDIIAPAFPGLAFIGLPYLVIPFPLCEVQARYLAAMWFGGASLPKVDNMLAWCEQRHQRNQADGVRLRHYHRLADAQFEYMATLLSEARLPPLPAWRQTLAEATNQLRMAKPEVFRSVDLPYLAPTVVRPPPEPGS